MSGTRPGDVGVKYVQERATQRPSGDCRSCSARESSCPAESTAFRLPGDSTRPALHVVSALPS